MVDLSINIVIERLEIGKLTNSMGADPGPAAPALSAPPLAAPGARLYADLSESILSPPNPPPDGGCDGRDRASVRACLLRVAGTISGGKWR